MLKNAGLVASTSDGNRMIDQGAVRVGDSAETLDKVAGRDHSLAAGTFLIQVGKHKYRWVDAATGLAGPAGLGQRFDQRLAAASPAKIRLSINRFTDYSDDNCDNALTDRIRSL